MGGRYKKSAYHAGLLASRVVHRDERGVEVVEVYFTLSLKLVKEVEETKREGGTGAGPSRRKPACTKKLGTAGDPDVVT